ncbi:MAG: ACDE family multidrug resistance protein [Cellvibrionaceae bacterium]
MLYRRPFLVNQISSDVTSSLGRLAAVEGFVRSILVGVLPIIAFQIFGSKEAVSRVYFFATAFTLVFTLNIQLLEQLLKRKGLVTLSGILLIIAVAFYWSEVQFLFAAGIGIQAAGASMFSVCISLYVMDYIGKTDFTRSESRRIMYVGGAWLIGPVLGGWLFDAGLQNLLFLIAASAAFGMIIYFWKLRLGDDQVIKAATSQAANPIKAIVRFAKQPNLRIAYLITLSRACFWATLFTYGPIYAIESGFPIWVGGLLLSAASGFLCLSPVVNWLADKFGTRQVLITSTVLIGFSLICLGLIGSPKPIGLLFFILGSLGAATMDVLSNIPFMRMVKPCERTAMTMVFTTWRESSSFLTQALVVITLIFAPFWIFYFVLAALQFFTAVMATYLPRRI